MVIILLLVSSDEGSMDKLQETNDILAFIYDDKGAEYLDSSEVKSSADLDD